MKRRGTRRTQKRSNIDASRLPTSLTPRRDQVSEAVMTLLPAARVSLVFTLLTQLAAERLAWQRVAFHPFPREHQLVWDRGDAGLVAVDLADQQIDRRLCMLFHHPV